MNNDYLLIGIDGGATKVSGWLINYDHAENLFSLSDINASISYSEIKGFDHNFKPVALQQQLADFQKSKISLTEAEKIQGETYVEACARVIEQLANTYPEKPVLAGIGMPGLKSEDRRGIAVVANGPRMPEYARKVEEKLEQRRVRLLVPIAQIGSDADYCGIGENFTENGGFKDIRNAYYLGGGTGAADAMILRSTLVPFDQTKKWMAKTWEMKNDKDISLERYASASGIQFIYSTKSGIPTAELNQNEIFPPRIAEMASRENEAAISTFQDVAKYLALLFFERISTLYCGSLDIFKFINESKPALSKDHLYREELFERIVVGQRLGDLMNSEIGREILTQPLLEHLAASISQSECLPDQAKNHYLKDGKFNPERIYLSPLRESPALGAGIDAWLSYTKK